MKSLNDLRQDNQSLRQEMQSDLRSATKDIKHEITTLTERLGQFESRVMRWFHIGTGIVLALTVLWGGYKILTQFYSINLTPKHSPPTAVVPQKPSPQGKP